MSRFSIVFTLSMLFSIGALAAAQDTAALKSIATQLDAHYDHIKSLRSDFVETYTGAGVKKRASGTLLLKKPGKMRWQYLEPRSQVFVSDGKTAYFYSVGDVEGRTAPVKSLDDLRSPLQYLLGKTKLLKEFSLLRLVSHDGEEAVLEGVPKGMEDRISDVRLTVHRDNILGIRISQPDGSVTNFEFSNMEDNVPISDSQFKPDAPAGIHWIESADLGPG